MVENPTTRETAEFFVMMLKLGWISKSALIAWADSSIIEQEAPDPALIEISMSSNQPTSELFSYLRQIRGSLCLETSVRMMFAYIGLEHDAGRRTGLKMAKTLHLLLCYGGQIDEVLPPYIIHRIQNFEMFFVDFDYYSHSETILERLRQTLDQELREVLDWGREYRDKLPPQCFPPPADRES